MHLTNRQKKSSWRTIFNKIHLWVGLCLCLPLIVLGLTGSILVFQDALIDFNTNYNLETGKTRPIEEIINAAKAGVPNNIIPKMYIAPEEPGKPATIRFSPIQMDGLAGTLVSVDPISLKILSIKDSNSGILRTIFMLHSSLLLKEFGGRNIVGSLGIIFLLMTITGIILWWPKPGKLKMALKIKKKASGLRLHRDIHSVVGIWGLLILITVIFTGIYLAFPKILGVTIANSFNVRDIRSINSKIKVSPKENINPINIDRAINIAREALDFGHVINVTLPSKADQPYRINLAYYGHTKDTPTIAVFVDPWSQDIIELQDPREYSLVEKFLAWQHTIHEGKGFGWLWQVLVFFAGLSPLLFTFTGTSMWLIKQKRKLKK